jgi:ribonucleoside-diphosphate reductase alpha chain
MICDFCHVAQNKIKTMLRGILMVELMVEENKKAKRQAVKKKATYSMLNKFGFQLDRKFTKPSIDPMSEQADIYFEKRDALITDIHGKVIFEQKNVEVPKSWSGMATNIVANKYFRGQNGTSNRENSVKQLILRVVNTIADWGDKDKYFLRSKDKEIFRDELIHLLVNQKMAFNSPVWFNVGIEKRPQCSACFINSIEDNMESILNLAKIEGMLFKWGSGTGTNFSSLRGKHEPLSSGGEASGPVSFMRGFDAFAGVIKSGGKTRRAAKMAILNIDHPDIVEFITCKEIEEVKAKNLINVGYDAGFNIPGGAYDSVMFQNANHSVRVNDRFMNAVVNNKTFNTYNVVNKKASETFNAREIWRMIAHSAWVCGDPGLQFDDVINRFHTCKNTARINASNPCSEYMFLDDTACNLASLNLMKFLSDDGKFDVASFEHAILLTILAQEIIVDHASYPTEKIAKNSHLFRPLGLGFANLGALLMSLGLPYDSDEGRALAASITALMGGHAYRVSSLIAKAMKPCEGFLLNKDPFLDVIDQHRSALKRDEFHSLPKKMMPILTAAKKSFDDAFSFGQEYGFRNCQVTVLAPTGTIGFMMDCDTTGIEPDIALVKYKKLVGGGMMKMVNNTLPQALKNLGYLEIEQRKILAYIEENDTIEGTPLIKQEHLPVFDCAFKPHNGERSIRPMGHVLMMAAVQPFLSGAISKTVNMPESSTVKDIEDIYLEAWKLGLKAIAIYRDGCKQSQPLSTTKDKKIQPATKPLTVEELIEAAKDLGANDELGKKLGMVKRRRLPEERAAITHKFSIGGHEGYLTVGLFEDGMPGELFCTMAKEGSTISGLMDVFATAISLALQYGVPLRVLIEKFSHTRFEPSGFTKNQEIPMASSVCDYIFRWLGLKFLQVDARPIWLKESQSELFFKHEEISTKGPEMKMDGSLTTYELQQDAPLCQYCGNIMIRNGACFRCINCGSTSGCS